MTELNRYSICRNCLGCNQLELETFKGVFKCENYIRGTNDLQNRWKDSRKTETKN